MADLAEALARVCDDLNAAGLAYALVGGLAVSARAEPRFTRDIDLAVATESDEDAERAVFALVSKSYRPYAQAESRAEGRLATVRFTVADPARDIEVDVLFASSGIESELVADAERLEVLPGVYLPVATVPYLIALKVLSSEPDERPTDEVDLRHLIRVATDADLQEVSALFTLICGRAYHRGRDLESMFEAYLSRFR